MHMTNELQDLMLSQELDEGDTDAEALYGIYDLDGDFNDDI